MSELKNVIEKLNRKNSVELSKVEIELGLGEDLEKQGKSIISAIEAAQKEAKMAGNACDKASASLSGAIKNISKTISDLDGLEKKSKDLGLGFPQNLKVMLNNLKAYENEADEVKKTLDRASDMIFGVLQ